jgi:hypothetical protein
VHLLWIIFGLAGLALLALPNGVWKALWKLIRGIREVHFAAKIQK